MDAPLPQKPDGPAFPPHYAARSQAALDQALDRLPAYRTWKRLDPGPRAGIDQRFAALPCTTKSVIRDSFPHGILLPDRDLDQGIASGVISLTQTSGTTSERVVTIWNQAWWDASERSSWKLNSDAARLALGNHREALLASPLCVGRASDDGDLPMRNRTEERFLFLNEKTDPSAWTVDHMDRMIAELNAFRPLVLEANPSFLSRLCLHIAECRREVAAPRLIVLSYEFPSRLHYRQIRLAFPSVPTMSSYGSTETGYILTQCEAGHFHQNADSCRIDFQPFKTACGDPAVGRLLVTPFGHPWFSLIRFDIADCVRFEKDFHCPCGRNSGFTFVNLEGRVRDITRTSDGRAVTVHALDEALGTIEKLLAYQLRQVSADAYVLRAAADDAHERQVASAASDALHRLYGRAARIEVEVGRDFPPEPSGKYRLAKPMIPIDFDLLFDKDWLME